MVTKLDERAVSLFEQSLETDVRMLITRYWEAAVGAAAKQLCKARVGRKLEPDWQFLEAAFHADADAWLDGNDPQILKSNVAVATEFAERHPGHNRASTHRRIMRKLAASRIKFYLIKAWGKSANSRPFADYFRAAHALANHDPTIAEAVTISADMKRGALVRYRSAHGEPPADMTIDQITKLAGRSPTIMTVEGLLAVVGGNPRSSDASEVTKRRRFMP